MPRKTERTITLPADLYEKVKEVIDLEMGYTSIADFCKEAIRVRLGELAIIINARKWKRPQIAQETE
jgi:hypothetical protein